MKDSPNVGFMVHHNSESSLVVEVNFKQLFDQPMMELRELVLAKLDESFSLGRDGVLRYQRRLCVPNVDGLRNRILEEDHGSRYSINSGSTKMYHDLREVFWWEGLKKDIAEFVSKCPNFQQVKVEHQKLGGLLQEIQIPTWIWEDINMAL